MRCYVSPDTETLLFFPGAFSFEDIVCCGIYFRSNLIFLFFFLIDFALVRVREGAKSNDSAFLLPR